MVARAVLADAAVEAHLGRVGPLRGRRQLADLVEADDLGPEAVRFLDVADVQHEMVDAARCDRLVHGKVPPVGRSYPVLPIGENARQTRRNKYSSGPGITRPGERLPLGTSPDTGESMLKTLAIAAFALALAADRRRTASPPVPRAACSSPRGHDALHLRQGQRPASRCATAPAPPTGRRPLAADGAKPRATWTIVARDDGLKQWAYNGKPVYAFAQGHQGRRHHGRRLPERRLAHRQAVAFGPGARRI